MADLLLEVGCEEIPSLYLQAAVRALGRAAPKVLTDSGLLEDAGAVQAFGTPRRLVVIARGLADSLPEETVWDAGPPLKVAFGPDGAPTKAAQGFARGKGVTVEQLIQRDGRIGVERHVPARPAADVLAEPLSDLITGLHWPKTMRWGAGAERFARPIHWICALVGGAVVPVSAGRVQAGSLTRGHRFIEQEEVTVDGPDSWLTAMDKGHVIADGAVRSELIAKQTLELAEGAGGRLVSDEALIADNAHLTEWPISVLGHFDEGFLEVPREVLCNAMRTHQRYFAIERPDGSLANAFIAVNNTAVRDTAVVRAGHERVLRARLADARFFWDEDRKRTLADRVHDLQGVIFLAKLAEPTMRDKADRLEAIGRKLAGPFGADSLKLDRAAELCKADLTTLMVQEFPDLQGVMGSHYARHDGQDATVVDAIAAHYWPKGADSPLPESPEAAVLAVADRLDTLAAGFACGLKPTGSKDAYGLRRAAVGVLRILRDRELGLTISALVAIAARRVDDTPTDDLAAFMLERLRHQLVAEGARGDVVDAVRATGLDEPVEIALRSHVLTRLVGTEEFQPVIAGAKRIRNIVAKEKAHDLPPADPAAFVEDAEHALFRALNIAGASLEGDAEFEQVATGVLAELKVPIDKFFEDVLVVHPDEAIKRNRLALCRDGAAVFGKLAAFESIQV